MDDLRIAVVVGVGGGIGRALADQLSQDNAYDRVVGLSRHPPEGWADGARQIWMPADILDEAALASAAAAIAALGKPARIIVATGLLKGEGVAPEKSMSALSAGALTTLFAVNAVGPALVAKHFLPLTPRDRPSLFAALSARVGSIGDNHLGGWHGYRASKAALNMLIRTLALENQRRRLLGICVALHPGTVDTPLSAPFNAAVPASRLFSPERSAAALMAVMDGLGPAANGGFFAWDGSQIPW
jgi:NAD(P)-dependent dehydrogenase (short-subunit alcohol dehydrogenase family)